MNFRIALLGLIAVAAAGCRQEKIEIYDAPRGRAATPAAPQQEHAHASSSHTFKLPEGWEQGPANEMRIASFTIKGENNAKADFGIIPLAANRGGGELDNVNRWRSALGQKALTQEELAGASEQVRVGTEPGRMYEISGPSMETDDPTRTIAVVVFRGDTGWYFKMTGDETLVAAQKPVFLQFLRNFNFEHGHAHAEDHAAGADPHAGVDMAAARAQMQAASQGEAAAPAAANLPAPATWQQQAPGMMQDAKFSAQKGKAIITVSRAGGALGPNIVRWQGQIGMQPSSEAEVAKLARPLDLGAVKATVVDLAGPKQSMVVVIVPGGDTSTFYKLMGEPAAVAAEKETLIEFVKKIK